MARRRYHLRRQYVPARWYAPGDQLRGRPPIRSDVVREIVDVRRTGYGWRYPEWGERCPNGQENYFWSENSNDPFLEFGWVLVGPADRVTQETL